MRSYCTISYMSIELTEVNNNEITPIYLLANFWWDILVGKPDLDIRTTSRTPQHLSCCNTSPCSYIPGDWMLLGLIQRIKCGVVLSKRCINWNNWAYISANKISNKESYIPEKKISLQYNVIQTINKALVSKEMLFYYLVILAHRLSQRQTHVHIWKTKSKNTL